MLTKKFVQCYRAITPRGEKSFAVHKVGCQDLRVEKERFGATFQEDCMAASGKACAENMIDSDMRDLGYYVTDVKIFDCAK